MLRLEGMVMEKVLSPAGVPVVGRYRARLKVYVPVALGIPLMVPTELLLEMLRPGGKLPPPLTSPKL
jgi:hypothetical protein